MVHSVLLVDDDTSLLMFVKEFLQQHGFKVTTALSGEEAVRLVHTYPKQFSVVILDYQMKSLNGAATAQALIAVNPQLPIVIYTGDRSREALLLSSRSGAFSIVDKSEGPTVFLEEVRRAALRYENEVLTVSDITDSDPKAWGMIGDSKALRSIASLIEKLRDKSGPVLILGESGTGKEIIARALHGNRKGAFKAVNCGDFLMSVGTARSELFGHVKGAFTGADKDKPGVFEQAKDGSVFLDEIYSLPPEAQIGLLRVLQEKTLTRLGGSQETNVSSRIISAAKPDLAQEISRRSFKADLFYRISQNIIEVPALRDRPEDIPALVDHFCKRWSGENGQQKTFLASTVDRLMGYGWPGNVRELENVVYSMLNISDQSQIRAKDLGARFSKVAALPAEVEANVSEREHFAQVLESSSSIREAAGRLGISHQAALRRMRKYGLTHTKRSSGGVQ